MAKLTRKCQVCGVDDTKAVDMELITINTGKKPVNKYYHKGDCYNAHLEAQAFKDKEALELDILSEVIKDIYGIKSVPDQVFPFLQKVRNGTNLNGKSHKRFKEGYTYDLIAETFEYCSDTIQYWNNKKSFDGTVGAVRYGLAIVCDKIQFVENRRKRRENQKQLVNIHLQNATVNVDKHEEEEINNYKKPTKNKGDFTDFLDD